jgi:phosphoglycolate phosphatase
MVGDSRTDVDTARAARLPFVGVSFGYTDVPMAELSPDALIHHFDELPTAALRLLRLG